MIRASSVSNYYDCPRRSATHLFRNLIVSSGFSLNEERQNVGAAIGGAMHAAVNYTMLYKINNNNHPGYDDDAIQVAKTFLNVEAEKGLVYDKVTFNKFDAEKQVIRKVRRFRGDVAPLISPLHAEKEFVAQYKGYEIIGHVDWIEVNHDIGDAKGGKWKGWHAGQLGTYSMLAKSNGFNPQRLYDVHLRTVPLKEPEPEPEITNYSVSDCERIATYTLDDIISDLERFRETGDRRAFRPNPSSNLCDPKYCPAFGTNFCREHKFI